MADITNAEAIRFANEQVRPLAEAARALMARIAAMETDWYAGINTVVGTGTGAVQDGRDDEGVSRLSQNDVTNCVANLIAIRAAHNSQIIAKPCVRSLTVG